jgi:hypothetical protein
MYDVVFEHLKYNIILAYAAFCCLLLTKGISLHGRQKSLQKYKVRLTELS